MQHGQGSGARRGESFVWDLPLRVCHWLLVAGVAVGCITGFAAGPWLLWHARSGAVILGLVIFRLVWGFIGSHHARFASFLPTPTRLRAYFKGSWRSAGHNPLGALSVLAMLLVLGTQLGTGLFATDDSDFSGPLYATVARATSLWLSQWHRQCALLLLGLITLHIVAITFYWARGTNLLRPMLRGTPSSGSHETIRLPAWRSIIAAALACILVAGLFNFARLRSTPVPPVATADW